MPKYVFFDIDATLLSTYSNTLYDITNVEVIDEPIDVRELEDIDVFVSPANSQGWMNGGIDAAYTQIFPNVQKYVQNKIAKIGYLDPKSGKAVLPVGSATIVTVENEQGNPYQLVCAPTMFYPSNISKTPENIFYAMLAVLKVTEYLPKDYIVAVPGMGTGVGRVTCYESARQIRKAFLSAGYEGHEGYEGYEGYKGHEGHAGHEGYEGYKKNSNFDMPSPEVVLDTTDSYVVIIPS
jgi:O-acetyl-ADP-ribose deacetylase (regulator of RNase III)